MSRLLSRREGDGLPGFDLSPAASYTGRAAFPNDPMQASRWKCLQAIVEDRLRTSRGNAPSCLAMPTCFSR